MKISAGDKKALEQLNKSYSNLMKNCTQEELKDIVFCANTCLTDMPFRSTIMERIKENLLQALSNCET